ncbi:MAG: hypothetical protein K2M19_08515, partial [Muribaculaceae bacterium]|nr:hypothetical protein [Muribaculaceae bacterium]
SVTFAGKEMLSELKGNTLLLPAGSNGSLVIRTNYITGVSAVTTDVDYSAPYEVYNLNGMKVGDSRESLLPGIYIVRQGQAVQKIAVN